MDVGDRDTCPSCGDRVGSVEGLCPRCLFRNALAGQTNPDGEGGRPDAGDTEGVPVAETGTRPEVDDGAEPIAGRRPLADGSGRLEFLDEIGQGGMGTVLRGRDPDLGRELAVKVLRDDLRDNPEMALRFVEEAQIAGQLQHPGVVPVYGLGRLADGRPYFAMKLVKGRTLSQILADGPSSEVARARALGIFEQICQTVAYAHAHGVIHRDLKPSNVMVGGFGEVQVMDWGLSKVLSRADAGGHTGRTPAPAHDTVIATARSLNDSNLTSAGSVLGTPSYMAPEPARGEFDRVDERADVFALGAILCEILSGHPAFTGPRAVDVQRRAADGDLSGAWLRLDSCGADAELTGLARDCLAPEREGRPRDAGVVASRLAAYLAGVQERLRAAEVSCAAEAARAEEATRTAEVARAQARAEGRARRLTAILAAAGVGLVAIVGVGAAWLQRQDARRVATTAHLVNDALAEARRREGEARTRSLDDPAGWDAALAEARRAADLLEQGRADATLRGRVDDVLQSLILQRREAADRAERLRADRKLLADLGAANSSTHFDLAATDRAFAAAFKAAGLDVDGSDPHTIGEWVGSRLSRADLVVYLDDWAHLRRWVKPGPGQHPGAELIAAARVADPDPWRDRLRAAWMDPTALRALADDEPGLEGQPARSLNLLGILLKDDARDLDRAMRILRLAWRRFPNDFWINYELAVCAAARADAAPPDQQARWLEDRVRFLTAAVASRPQSVFALQLLGNTLVDLSRPEDALEAYRGLTRLGLGAAAPYDNLGHAFWVQKKYRESAAAFVEAVRAEPDNAAAHVGLGDNLRELGNLSESLAELRVATRLEPRNAFFLYRYGVSLETIGMRDQAIAAYSEAFRIDCEKKNVGSVPGPLARLLRLAGRYDEAIAVPEAVLRIKPDDFFSHDLASVLLTERGRWPEALKHTEWVSEHLPDDPLPAARVALLRLLSGDEAGYRRQCLAMLDRFGGKGSGPTLYVVSCCTASARPVELERTYRLMEDLFGREKAVNPNAGHLGYTQLSMAAAEYRSGRFARAAELARGLLGAGGGLEIAAEIFLAMASHRLGDGNGARQQLAAATKALTADIAAHDEWRARWLDWLRCDVLLREAKALIGG